MKRISIFNLPVDTGSMSETVNAIRVRILGGSFTQHVVVNVAKVVNAQSDTELFESIAQSDIINVDGMGVVYGIRLLRSEKVQRVAGIDLFYELLSMASKERMPVFFLGATTEVIEQTVANIQAHHPALHIAGYHHGYFWENENAVVEKIRNSGAKLLFVAITSPKKEVFINKWKDELGVLFAMGVGGTFDIVAGKTKRAPKFMQNVGLEWLYRALQEPRRLFMRYLRTNAAFVYLCIREWVGMRRRSRDMTGSP